MPIDVNEVIQGQRQSWNLIDKLGEGDAGEVYLAESVLDKQRAIVKRPRRGSFFSDILRQANQIRTEGSILRGIPRNKLPQQVFRLHIPTLIDQNKSDAGLGEQTFIVIEQAKGMDIKQLSQLIRFGQAGKLIALAGQDNAIVQQQWSQFDQFPAPLLVRILLAVIELLETIHSVEISTIAGVQPGVLWNDVKPDHIYWHPKSNQLTFIDWGNSQLLETGGVTKDRKYSSINDLRQFIQEMGNFVEEVNAELYEQLEWPQDITGGSNYRQSIELLKEKLSRQLEINSAQLRELRRQETSLYEETKPNLEQLRRYEELEHELAKHGELPDHHGANNFMFKAAYQLAAESKLDEFQTVCREAGRLQASSTEKWLLLDELVEIAKDSGESVELSQQAYFNAITAGLAEDWGTALWELFAIIGDGPRPDWWEKLSQKIRKTCLGLEPDALSPYTMLARLYYTLQAEIAKKGNQRLQAATAGSRNGGENLANFHWQASEELLTTFNEEIIRKWKEIEPNPPNSGIRYTEVESVIEQIEKLLPDWREKIESAMKPLDAQVDLVLEAWEKKDFELARRGLRSILVWDPDRTRLYTAQKAIQAAPQWLARVRKGAGRDEPFYDYLTSVELEGRNLRNQVGAAKWLDDTLEAFKRLRRGARSVDLLIEYPDLLSELPWLNEYQSREILSLPHTRPISLERDVNDYQTIYVSQGVMEGKLGANQSVSLGEPLDTWRAEARGSSARVFAGNLSNQKGEISPLAFKVIRPDQMEYALPLFIEEVQILTMMRDVPGITPMVECGYLKLDAGQSFPNDESHASAEKLTGQVVHYGPEYAQNYLASMDRQLAAGWLPYLALIKRNPETNLLRYCDASYTHGWFLALRESLLLSIQICDILQFAHDRNITYRDHKILHYYWDAEMHGVTVIDWNIAKRQPQGLSDAEKQFDLVQFGARGLHHILAGRPAQGSLPLGPNRPEDIEKASTHYPVDWTYDDERLPEQLRNVLERCLNQGYTQVREIRQDLLNIYQQLPDPNKK